MNYRFLIKNIEYLIFLIPHSNYNHLIWFKFFSANLVVVIFKFYYFLLVKKHYLMKSFVFNFKYFMHLLNFILN